LRFLKAGIPKRTRDVDLRRTCGRISAILEKVTLEEIGGVEQEFLKVGEVVFI
jgi:hypothetical protein